MLAVGPPRSEVMPVKPGVRSRTSSTSRRIDWLERLWIRRPSCGNRAEGAAAEATTQDIDRETDHLPDGHARLAVGRVRAAARESSTQT